MKSTRHAASTVILGLAQAMAVGAGCGRSTSASHSASGSDAGPTSQDAGANDVGATIDAGGIPQDAAEGDVVDGGGDAAPYCPPGTSFQSDPHNCGSCGHDCLGGTCTSAVCGPFEIYYGNPGDDDPVGYPGCDDTGMYWGDIGHPGSVTGAPLNYTDGAIRYLPNTSTTVASLTPFPMSGLAVTSDGTNIYFITSGTWSQPNTWHQDGQVLQCPATGCTTSPLLLAQGNPDAGKGLSPMDLTAIVKAGSTVLWSGSGSSNITPVGGGGTKPIGTESLLLAATSAYVYWTDQTGNLWANEANGGGAAIALDPGSGSHINYGLVVDSSNIYLLRSDTPPTTQTYLASCPAPLCTGGPQQIIGSLGPESFATGLAQNESPLYWFNPRQTPQQMNTIQTCTKVGCTPRTLAVTTNVAQRGCATQSTLYFLGQGIGRLAL